MMATSYVIEVKEAVALAAALVAALAALVTAGFVYLQARRMHETVEATLLLDIFTRMNNLYPKRHALLASPLVWADFDSRFPTLEEKFNSQEWNQFGEVAGFYDFLGVLVKRGYLSLALVTDLVSVDVGLWEKYYDVVEHMRLAHAPGLWENWEYLLVKSRGVPSNPAAPADRKASLSGR